MADLTATDYAFLILLQREGREISNTELQERHGIRLVGDNYARLNGLGLIVSQKRRSYHHELTPQGEKALQRLATEKRTRKDAVIIALAELHAGRPPAPTFANLEERIRAAYTDLAPTPRALVRLSALRRSLSDVAKADLDKELQRLYDTSDVLLDPEPAQMTLSNDDLKAAVVIGGERMHAMAIGMR